MSLLTSIWSGHIALALMQTTAAAVAILLLARFLPSTAPRVRHAVLMVGLVKFALPPMLPLPTGVFSAAPPAGELNWGGRLLAANGSLVRALVLLHAAGALIVLARLAIEAIHLSSIRRRSRRLGSSSYAGVPIPPRAVVVASSDLNVPVTFGIFRPVIVIPERLLRTLSAEALRDVLLHEGEHVRRHHVLLNTFQSVLGAAWWFNPLYHLLSREARAAREECCDDAVVARSRQTVLYARTLLSAAACASASAPLAAARVADSRSGLLRRLERMARPGFVPSVRVSLAALLLVAALAMVILPGFRVSRDNRFAFDHATRRALHFHNH